MECPLLIGGKRILKNPFRGNSPFYEGYSVPVANAGPLEIASAIGCARQAARASRMERAKYLENAARAFAYQDADIEHAVRMTGMPLIQVATLFQEIPGWLRGVPQFLETRFPIRDSSQSHYTENLRSGLQKLLIQPEGFCYAVTPGNDPRSSALVAANLGALGIPFILKASPRDAIAPLVIQALIQGGFDPNFCNLLYFESTPKDATSETVQKHFKLVDASDCVWTFGPNQSVDQVLRYEITHQQAVIELSELDKENLKAEKLGANTTRGDFQLESRQVDHFEGKIVLRHNSGNCAAITYGKLAADTKAALGEAISFPLGCTATKSIMLVNSISNTIPELAGYLSDLVVGDPLNPDTQIGYINPRTLDFLQETLTRNRVRAAVYGGERVSRQQARPLLVASQDDLPDFFGQEIPAYLLSVKRCDTVTQAVNQINKYTGIEPRLAVSFFNIPESLSEEAFTKIRAHAVLLNQPTSKIIPFFHEGNDYVSQLMERRLLFG